MNPSMKDADDEGTGPGRLLKIFGKGKNLSSQPPPLQNDTQTQAGTATSLPNLAQTLPVVSCMEDFMKLNDDMGTNIKLDRIPAQSLK
jgi:hypothetical protein